MRPIHRLDLASLLLQLALNLGFSRLVLDDCVFQTLVLLVDRFDPRLVVADLGLHVAAFAPEVPGVALGPGCRQNSPINHRRTS